MAIGNLFTTSEYIEANNLDVSPHNGQATRLIAAHLRAKGYTPRRIRREGKFIQVWDNTPRPDYSELKDKLKSL